MAFLALYQDSTLDSRLPMSSVLWTVLFWAATNNRTILPDAFGSATFRYMLEDLRLIGEVSAARQESPKCSTLTPTRTNLRETTPANPPPSPPPLTPPPANPPR